MEDFRAFVRTVWIWKSAGIAAWTSLYLLVHLSLGLLLAVVFNLNFYPWAIPLSIVTDMLTLFLYIRCLKIIPVRYSVLTLDELFRRALFFVSAFVCFFMNIFALSNVDIALYQAIAFTLMLWAHLDFTIPVETARETQFEVNRKMRMAREYRSPSVALVVIEALLLWVFFGPFYTMVGLSMFRLAKWSLCLCAVVCSERTSFAQKHSCERLTYGLNCRSRIVRYWAYSDLLAVVCDKNRERRRFLFDDDGDRFKDVAHRIIELIDSFTVWNKELSEKEFESARAKKVASPGLRRRVLSKRMRMKPVERVTLDSDNDNFVEEWKNDRRMTAFWMFVVWATRYFAKWATNYWKRFWAWWTTRKERVAREDIERLALQNGILVDKAIMIIAKLVLISPKEDKIGVVPQRAEEFLDALLDLRRALGKSSYHEYESPPFLIPWAFRSYQDMSESLRQQLDIALEEILANEYSSQFDIGRLKKKNREFYESFGALDTKDRISEDAAVVFEDDADEDKTQQKSDKSLWDVKKAGRRLVVSMEKFWNKWIPSFM